MTKKDAPKFSFSVRNTGKKVDALVMTLLGSEADSSDKVKNQVSQTLKDLGHRETELVLSSSHFFIYTNSKSISQDHRIRILKVMTHIIEQKRDCFSKELALELIQFGIFEMTSEKQVIAEWQGAASILLVQLGQRFPGDVLDRLLEHFPIGTQPHFFIMKTLGELSNANPLQIVPRLKEVLARVLPVLGAIKQDNMRWVFSSSVGYFCESILNYVANIDQAPDKTITVDSFSSEIFPAYEIMFNTWLLSKENKVKLATVEATGSMCSVMKRAQFENQLAKILSTLLSMYKKDKEHLPVTKGLCEVLTVAIQDESRVMEPLLVTLLTSIFPLVCIPDHVFLADPSLSKNQNELLRCFEIVGQVFSDQVSQFILNKLESKESEAKIGAMRVLKHLISRLDSQLNDKKGLIVGGMKALVSVDNPRKVNKMIAQVIIAMASKEYLSIEGGQSLLFFIIKHCSISDAEISSTDQSKTKKADPDPVPLSELRHVCDHILNLFTTTIPCMEKVLWPAMFEALLPDKYTEGLSTVLKCLAHIANNKRANNDPEFLINFEEHVNLPKPPEIIVRLLVLLNAPHKRGQLGQQILAFMKASGPLLQPSIVSLWDSTLPKLGTYIEENADEWDQNAWEDLILRLLAESIKATGDEGFTKELADYLSQHLTMYSNDLKKSAFKLLGLVLQKLNHREFIKSKLTIMFQVCDHSNAIERQGCTQGYGYTAASHLDVVLEKLQDLLRSKNKEQKSAGLLSFLKDSGPKDVVSKHSIILAFGYVTAYAPPGLITSRIEVHIINPIKPFFADAKSPVLKECIIRAVDLIGKALHPSRLHKEFTLTHRDELLKYILSYMCPDIKGGSSGSGPTSGPMLGGGTDIPPNIISLALKAISTLIRLQPLLSKELEETLLEKTLQFFHLKVNSDGKKQAVTEEDLSLILNNLSDMVLSLLYMNNTISNLKHLLLVLSRWTCSEELHHRERACITSVFLLRNYLTFRNENIEKKKLEQEQQEQEQKEENAEEGTEKKKKPQQVELEDDRKFTGLGECIAIFIPRCCDPGQRIRKASIDAIQKILVIDYTLRKAIGEENLDTEVISTFNNYRQRSESDEVDQQFALVNEMANSLSESIPDDELHSFLINLFTSLSDPEQPSASGSCIVLNGILKIRGKKEETQVKSLVEGFIRAMDGIKFDHTMNGTLHSFKTLAIHFPIPVLDQLLESPIPHSRNVMRSLQVIGKDSKLVMMMVQHLTDIINNSEVVEQKPDPKNKSKYITVPSHRAMAATCSLGEIMETQELHPVVKSEYPLVFVSLLLRIGTANMSGKEATEQIVSTFKQFIICSGDEENVGNSLDEAWEKAVTSDYNKAITQITSVLIRLHLDDMKGIYKKMKLYLNVSYVGQRVVAATSIAELINHCGEDASLLSELINGVLGSLPDTDIKFYCLRGLGNVVSNGSAQVNQYASTILDALMSSIDDENDTVAMEAMNGLSKVFAMVDEARIAPIIVNICHRIRPAFEKQHDEIRSAAFNLFGTLYRFGQTSAFDSFYEQIHNNLPFLIVHANDEHQPVRESCKKSLHNLSVLFKQEEVSTFLHKLYDENSAGRTLAYEEFLSEWSRILIKHFPDRISYNVIKSVDYFKSSWSAVRANGVLYTGYLMGGMSEEQKKGVPLNPGMISNEMIGLMKDKNAHVREKCAYAMALMYSY